MAKSLNELVIGGHGKKDFYIYIYMEAKLGTHNPIDTPLAPSYIQPVIILVTSISHQLCVIMQQMLHWNPISDIMRIAFHCYPVTHHFFFFGLINKYIYIYMMFHGNRKERKKGKFHTLYVFLQAFEFGVWA